MFSLFKKKKSAPKVACIVPAAGSATRMAGEYGEGKQLIELCGVPLLVHTLTALQRAESIDHVVVVARQQEMPDIAQLVQEYHLSKVHSVVRGGASRLESVANGLSALPEGFAYVAVHDGARPLCTPALIDRVVEAAQLYGAALPGVAPKDTVRQQKGGVVKKELKRDELILAQTPQVFALEEFDVAMGYALTKPEEYTDDAAVYSLLGKTIAVVEGDYCNIKVTTPEDVPVAELWLEERL